MAQGKEAEGMSTPSKELISGKVPTIMMRERTVFQKQLWVWLMA